MSIVVAVKKQGKIIIAADSMISFGNTVIHEDNSPVNKIYRVGGTYIGTTGWSIYDNILNDYLQKQQDIDLESRNAIFSFFINFWKTMHNEYSFVNDQSEDEEKSPFADLDSEFLVVNRSGIFFVSSDMGVTQFKKFFAIGSGSSLALGALNVLYDLALSPEEIAKAAINTAIKFNDACGGRIIMKKLDLT
ncbi:MAG: hypothetical protein CVV44_10220 [Spirochaetae bacterium HGW-Spirochaetae-1]|jgi:ATP-dependent protease HslVU (ClpYQ) peptidase subunit|nr:MAG: hypothetical protein CVV44_10220 [Spirochaetae bacterium HGW-Spirochaetae-1]